MSGPESRDVTIYDVASECGVAPSTVSRALSQPGRVSARTSQRVHEVARRLGYRSAPLARHVPEQRTGTLAMIVSDVGNPVYAPMVRGAEEAAATAGYTLVLCDVVESAVRERQLLDQLAPNVDGLVLATSRLSDAAIRMVARRRPMVTMNRVTQQVPSILPDNEHGMCQAVEYLAGLGHRRLIHVAGPAGSWAAATRWRALRDAAASAGMRVRRIGPYPPTVAGGQESAAAITEELRPERAASNRRAADRAGPRPDRATALVTYNDLQAIGLIQALSRQGVRVPAEVSVVGWDNILGSDWCVPALTTVAAPLLDLGAAAVRHLLAVTAGRAVPAAPIVLPTRLLVRDSTGPVSAAPVRLEPVRLGVASSPVMDRAVQ
ncbi:LacI family DNA-binding transcriptional regulator [Phytoactinopolyspora limicola]|uniref:LacI family DNA-binding transcriptional regulator n=1 Tax=Phytoactinopolyspora limicola TaxID=2715536 RepID=UPI00140B471C|nr:LacI family DNA-binding transcriptional regulator [Phytoactinopolyspora limicola]